MNGSQNLAKFIRHVPPAILAEMQAGYGWCTKPRTVVHDKASYMVTSSHERLHITFADALAQAGLISWIGGPHATSKWLVSRLGDLYLHETVVSHIRRLLEHRFPCLHAHETVAQFRARMDRVVHHMNSDAFGAGGGASQPGLRSPPKVRGARAFERRAIAEVIRVGKKSQQHRHQQHNNIIITIILLAILSIGINITTT